MPKILLILPLLFTLWTTSWASPTLNDYGSLPTVSMLSISPNGDTIAFRRVQDGHDTLNIISLAEKKALPGLDLSRIQPKRISFLNDSNIFLQASTFGRVSGFRGKFETSTGFAFDLQTNSVRQLLIPGKDSIYPGQVGLGQIVGFSKDRNHVLMPAFLGTTDLVLGKPVDPNYSLVQVRVDKRARPKRVAAGSLHSTDFFVDQKGHLIAEERYDQRRNHHSIWAMKDGSLKEVLSETTEIRNKSWVGLTPDVQSLVFLDTNEETGRSDYYEFEIATGKITSGGFGREDADIESVITDSNRIVHGVRYSGFTPSYKFFDAKLNKRIQNILALYPEQSVWITDQSPDWKHIVVYVTGSNFAGNYYLISENEEPTLLTRSRTNIADENIHPIGKTTITARDGLAIPTLLTIPQQHLSNMKNLPAVIFPHGGPRSYDRIEFDFFTQALAAEGYMVVQPQFRGSSGFGAKHAIAGNGEWGGKMQEDITDTLSALSEKGLIDPSRVCIAGMSYGGYAALMGGALTPSLYKCVVSINGVTNLSDMYQYDKFEHGHNHEVVIYMERQFAANAAGEIDRATMKARSPDTHADAFTAPVLLIHAENDKIVPFKQSSAMNRALKRKKKAVELVKLKGDSHYLENNETRIMALENTIKFINAHLKP